jgi:hypothetical protein
MNIDLMVTRVALGVHTHIPEIWKIGFLRYNHNSGNFWKQEITTYRTGGSFMKTGSSLRFLK